jgi:NTE family protein
MPFGSEGVEPGIGVALSGGGFRAALFHIGTFWRLAELGVLPDLTRISSVSGGSIFSGVLACHWKDIVGDASPLDAYQNLVVGPLRQFCSQHIDSFAIGEGLLAIFGTAADAVEAKYAPLMPLSLDQLPDSPTFVFNASNLQTGRDFRFSKPYMGDYRIGLIQKPTIAVAKAATASSAFPPFLSPVILDHPGVFEPVAGADLNGNPEYTDKIYLADGGVYDNLGLETVWNRCQTVLVSDAGAPFKLATTVGRIGSASRCARSILRWTRRWASASACSWTSSSGTSEAAAIGASPPRSPPTMSRMGSPAAMRSCCRSHRCARG